MGTAGHSRHSTDQRDGRAQLPSRAALRMAASLAATSPGRAAPRERGRAAGASPAPLGRPLGPGHAVPAAACFRLSPMRDGRAARYAGAPGTTYPESRARRSPGRRPSTPSPTRSPARSRHRPGSPQPAEDGARADEREDAPERALGSREDRPAPSHLAPRSWDQSTPQPTDQGP